MKNVNVDGRSYCVIAKGRMKHQEAVKICKSLNARLPLPRNKIEFKAFIDIMGNLDLGAHADALNPKKTDNKSEWVDAEGEPIGNRDVYVRGFNKNDKYICLFS